MHHIHACCRGGRRKMLDSPELDLGMLMKYIVATGNQAWVFQKSNQCS